jgi:hypothetical protein
MNSSKKRFVSHAKSPASGTALTGLLNMDTTNQEKICQPKSVPFDGGMVSSSFWVVQVFFDQVYEPQIILLRHPLKAGAIRPLVDAD